MNIHLMIILTIGFSVISLIAPLNTFAADSNDCSADIARFCKGVDPNRGGAVLACLERHEESLSEPCKKYETEMGGKRLEARELMREKISLRRACKQDVETFCADTKPGKGVIEKCLTANKGKISVQCREKLNAVSPE
ncbi:MAG TPA: cysteine rich repeat-containing protein [Dissulfurispiraceae bacterium]|nr:cysteine rich repeat-containing protein [Dissulfurispiraceae bacterium]